MDKKLKKQLLIVTIIILLVINISALITIFYNSKVSERKLQQAEILRQERQINGMHHFFRDQLKLSEEQFSEFKAINDNRIKISRNISHKLHNNRILILEEVAKVNPDLKELDRIAKEIGQLHYELKENTINQFMEMKSICNAEQQEALQQIFLQMINEQDKGGPRMGRGKNREHRERRRPNGYGR